MSRKKIRALVEALLKEHLITSAPIQVETIARSTGAEIIKDDLGDAALSGFAIHKAGSKIIGVNSTESDARQRFTIAHELGHLFLHKDTTVNYDQGGMMLFRTADHSSTDGTDVKEIEANRFAAELLMPESLLRIDLAQEGLTDLEADDAPGIISKLADKYEVSFQAMSIRLATLYFG